jgi:hypothetical protein
MAVLCWMVLGVLQQRWAVARNRRVREGRRDADQVLAERRQRAAAPVPGSLADWTPERLNALSDEDRAAAIEGWR